MAADRVVRAAPGLLTLLVLLVSAGTVRAADQQHVMGVCETELKDAKSDAAAIAAELAEIEKAPPRPAPGEGDRPGVRPEKVIEQARQDRVWLDALVAQAQAQFQAAQQARNEAERQVALKDALLKTAAARQLATSIRAGVDLLAGREPRTSAAPPPPAQRDRPFRSADFLRELERAAEQSQRGAAAADPQRAHAWARAAFGDPTPTPGGILFSRALASELVANLRIQGVTFDTARREIVVAGERTTERIDPDLLATGLRLGLEPDQPYFSLDPLAPETWAQEWDRLEDHVQARLERAPYLLQGYQCTRGQGPIPWALLAEPDGARRIARQCPGEAMPADLAPLRTVVDRLKRDAIRLRAIDGEVYDFVTLDALDPELRADVGRRFRIQERLAMEPSWLRATRVGEVLYHADVALKELWMPFAQHDGVASRVLRVPDVTPFKVFRDPGTDQPLSETQSQRWWFVPGAAAAGDDRFLDLSRVEPRLHIAVQDRGHDAPGLSISPWDARVQRDVNHRFPEYAAAIPEWAELAHVFRAYVLALWLKEKAPELSAQLRQELPEPRPPTRPLPQLNSPLIVIAHKDPRIERDGDGLRWWVRTPGIRLGGISFTRAELSWTRPGEPSAHLRAALASDGGADIAVVRLRLGGARQLPPALAAVKPASPGVLEAELRARYESDRRGLKRRQGGLLAHVAAVISWGEYAALASICAAAVGLAGRWRLG